tara:strand:+ start:227 stop:454 length:228 start_codon:yes stop_codon:yes gene_type:complete
MKRKKEKIVITKKDLAKIFPYHLPNTLIEDDIIAIDSKETSKEELGAIYSRVFNSDNSYSEKRYSQLKRIRKEYK